MRRTRVSVVVGFSLMSLLSSSASADEPPHPPARKISFGSTPLTSDVVDQFSAVLANLAATEAASDNDIVNAPRIASLACAVFGLIADSAPAAEDARLEQLAQAHGFKSFAAWAAVGDRLSCGLTRAALELSLKEITRAQAAEKEDEQAAYRSHIGILERQLATLNSLVLTKEEEIYLRDHAQEIRAKLITLTPTAGAQP